MIPEINVIREQKYIEIEQGKSITVEQNKEYISVEQGVPKITVEKNEQHITVIGTNNMANFFPFTFTCTVQGQTTFGPLLGKPKSIWVAITGAIQNQAIGDFTISGTDIILSQGANLGDTIYGLVQL